MKRLLLLVLILLCLSSYGQSLVGRYDTDNESHTNKKHYEELILNADSSFSYVTRMEFIKVAKEGKWSVDCDTLILNEAHPTCDKKIIVEEKRNKKLPKGKARFYVTSVQGDEINYHLVIINGDSTQTKWSLTGTNEFHMKDINSFYLIVNSLLYTPIYRVKSRRSNEFWVQVCENRFFYNEKWLISNGNIVPLGWDNRYASYYLSRQN